MFIDTHCHLAYMVDRAESFFLSEEDLVKIDQIIAACADVGVNELINIGTTPASSAAALQVAMRYPHVYATATLHPSDVTETWQDDVYTLKAFVKEAKTQPSSPNDILVWYGGQAGKLVAIGECGLDYHYPGYDKLAQRKVFESMIELAAEYDLPLVIHTRDAFADTIDIMRSCQFSGMRGVFHCYSETIDQLDMVFDLGFMIGITGAVSYPKNEHLRDVVRVAGLDRIVLETDAPFLAPQKKRGKPNTPEYIPLIADTVTQVLGCSIEEVAVKTTANAQKLFALNDHRISN
ncbi:MAG: Deoxyribonuclease [candidate division TM6 bacterium GW2011_GWE2_41_16]|nr:MAG: Deoxyribonuclease [candidate division TM6 bacterium GW2011_GWE2_41_16]